MKKGTIEQKINLILENAYVEETENYIFKRNFERYVTRTGTQKVEVEPNPEDIDFVNKQVELLKKLYISLSPDDRTKFKAILLKRLFDGSFIIGRTVFNALMHLGFFNEALKLIKATYQSYTKTNILHQLNLLSEVLKNEWNIFSMDQIESISEWINEMIDGKNKIGRDSKILTSLYEPHSKTWIKLFRQTNTLLVNDLDLKLDQGIDLEISQDQSTLTTEFKRFGFPDDLEETLRKIDQKLRVATDNFDYKNCMDLLRSFTERLFDQIAKAIPIENWRTSYSKDSKETAKLFKKAGFISEDQAMLLISLRHFLSNMGSHRLKSPQEDARLSRNMTIEFSLYLMKRLESKKEK